MIIIPWGKYGYKRLPIEIASSLDILQQKMNDLFNGFEFIPEYIYDLLILTKGDWKDYILKLEITLNNLKGKGLKFNIDKSLFGQTEMEYLGFWVTRVGVKPTRRNTEAIKIRIHLPPEKNYDSL